MTTQENHVIISNPPVGPEPLSMICPHCHESITSVIDYTATARTHLHYCFLCAPCIYCNKNCLAKEHTCPNCEKYVGTYDH